MIYKLLGWGLKIKKKDGTTVLTWGRFNFFDYVLILVLVAACAVTYKIASSKNNLVGLTVNDYFIPYLYIAYAIVGVLFLRIFLNQKAKIVLKNGSLIYKRRVFTLFRKIYTSNDIRSIEMTKRKRIDSSDYDEETTYWVKIVLNKNQRKIKLGHFIKKEANQIRAELERL